MNLIYFLKKDNDIVYVGRTKNIKQRIQTHKREKKKDFDSYKIAHQCFDLKDAKNIEDHFIMQHNPIYNRALNSCGEYFSIKDITKDKNYDVCELLHFINLYNVRPLFKDKYCDRTIFSILEYCEVKK